MLWPQTAFSKDPLHALEPPGHGGVIGGGIEWLWLTCLWDEAMAHGWTTLVVRPTALWV